MTITKADLARQIYLSHLNLSKARSTEAVEWFLKLSKKSLISGHDLLLSGFGKFKVRDKVIRRGRNPQTGGEIYLPARRVVTFKLSGVLRSRVNGDRH